MIVNSQTELYLRNLSTMKNILLFVLLGIAGCPFAHGQDWKLFQLHRVSLFETQEDNYWLNSLKSIRMDSFSIDGSDTIYYHYPTRYLIQEVTTCGPGYFFPDAIRVKPDFVMEMVNISGDTMRFDFGMALGDSIHVGNIHTGVVTYSVKMKFDTLQTENILGYIDSVKVYSITITDINQQFENIIVAKLSKSFGFVVLPSFYYLGEYNYDLFRIVGLDNPPTGIQNVQSIRDFLDMDIGDELHQIRVHGSFDEKIIYKVTDKQWLPDSLGVHYNYSICSLTTYHVYYGNPTADYIYQYDSSAIDIIFTDWEWLLSLPDSAILYVNDNEISQMNVGNYIPEKKVKSITSCTGFKSGVRTSYIDGFVFPIEQYGIGADPSDISIINFDTYLLYYHKTNYTWGTPYDCDYFQILAALEEAKCGQSFSLFPNPATKFIEIRTDISLEGTIAEIYNPLGQLSNIQSADGRIIELSDFPAGVYYLILKTQNGKILGGKSFIKQ